LSDPSGGVIPAFWIAFGASAIAAYPIFRLLLALKSRQTVSQFAPEGHQVKQGTPTMGGLIILIGIVSALVVIPTWALRSFGVPVVPVGTPSRGGDFESWGQIHGFQAVATLLLVLAFAAIGFIDDFLVPRLIKGKRGLGWKQKILMQVLAALLAVPAVGLGWSAAGVGATVFVVLFFSNAYNFADGLDALAGTLGVLLFGGLGVLSYIAGGIDVPICAAMVGAFLPFLFLNAPPAKVFMGDVGSLPIGALLGLEVVRLFTPAGRLALQAADSAPYALAWPVLTAFAIFSFVMLAEIAPPPLQVFWVKVFKRKLFPFTPIHHAFEKAGWRETRVVFVFGLVQALCVALAITLICYLERPERPRIWSFNGGYFESSVDR